MLRSLTRTIASRLFLSYLAVVLVGTVAAAITISGLLLRYENDQTKLRLEELSAPFLTAIQTGVRAGQQPRDIVASLTEQAHAADSRLLITTPLRRVVVDSEGTLINAQLPQPSASNIGEFTDGDEQWIFVRQQLRQAVASAGGLGFIVVARPRAVFTDTLRALLPSLALSGLVALAFALLIAALLARTITRPLRDLVGGVRRFAGGDYGTRVPLAGPSEVAEMGTALNEMASEIQRSRGSEQAFLADISHELRTPLTSIQGFAQAIVEGEARGDAVSHVAEIIHREARRLVRMVEGLLQVARLESGAQSMAREDVVPARLLERAVAAPAGPADAALPAVLSRRGRASGWRRPGPRHRAGDRASARRFDPRLERRGRRRGVRCSSSAHAMTLKALLFDLDNTLVPEMANYELAFDDACRATAVATGIDLASLRQAVFGHANELWEQSATFAYCSSLGIGSPTSLLSEFPG